MVFKLIMAASKNRRRLNGEMQMPNVIEGVRFQDGIEVPRNVVTERRVVSSSRKFLHSSVFALGIL
jgi:hypothetical protein